MIVVKKLAGCCASLGLLKISMIHSNLVLYLVENSLELLLPENAALIILRIVILVLVLTYCKRN